MKNQIGVILLIAAVSLGFWFFMESGHYSSDDRALKTQYTCDSLRRANREHELHIMQLEEEVDNLQDQLSDCTEDFQNCLAGRKIEIRYRNGNILTSNPEY